MTRASFARRPNKFHNASYAKLKKQPASEMLDGEQDRVRLFLQKGLVRLLVICPSGYFVAGGDPSFRLEANQFVARMIS
jgi:hypothetical protein